MPNEGISEGWEGSLKSLEKNFGIPENGIWRLKSQIHYRARQGRVEWKGRERSLEGQRRVPTDQGKKA